jgi:hypothetical protein
MSEGEESDIDITDIGGPTTSNPGKKEDSIPLAAISTTATQEHKGGPRVNDVVEIMVDLGALKEVKQVSELPPKASKDTTYLTIQGLENSQ